MPDAKSWTIHRISNPDEDLLPYFRRSETTHGRDPRYRGTDGPMKPGRAINVHPVACALLRAFEQLGYPLAADLNGADREGASRPELTVADGVRQSAADAYLRPILDRTNLNVITGAAVRPLTLSGMRCTGVEYLLHGDLRTAEVAGEVILCAGAIGSPHLPKNATTCVTAQGRTPTRSGRVGSAPMSGQSPTSSSACAASTA